MAMYLGSNKVEIGVNSGGGGGGSSDFSTATMTVVNNTNTDKEIFVANIIDVEEEDYHSVNFDFYSRGSDTGSDTVTAQVVLYKGVALAMFNSGGVTITLSGDIEDDGGGYYIVTGDGTITIS